MNQTHGPMQTLVVQVSEPCRNHFEVVLRAAQFANALPGQFIQILCRDSEQTTLIPMLRRPFSIGGLQKTNDGVLLNVLGHVIGPGTRWLSQLKEGDLVDIIGPLGSAFNLPPNDCKAILVAGGIGLPPIRWFAERLARDTRSACAIFGSRNKDLIPMAMRTAPKTDGTPNDCLAPFAAVGIDAAVTTEDGSLGLRGRVTDALQVLLERERDQPFAVYACGPNPMLEAVAKLCATRDVACEVALERVMGCGMGTCQSCVVPVNDHAAEDGWRYALCCSEGPVFDATRVIWQP